MNAPLYTTEILRLAASLANRARWSARTAAPSCARRPAAAGSALAVQLDGERPRRSGCRMQVHACAFGQASAALVERHAIGRTHDEVPEALVALSRWLARRAGRARRLAGHRGARAGASRKSRHGAILLPFRALARGDRGRRVTTPAETAQATTAILESGAIMLGAALVFVTLFRRLKLGATLGYIVAGALIGPQALGLISDPEQLTSVTEIGIALLLFIVGLELQPSRLWRLRRDIFGLGLAQVVLCGLALSAAALPRARFLARGRAGDRPAAGAVVDRAGAAEAALGQ